MNTRQVHILFNFSKVIQENCYIIHVFCKSWEPEVVFVFICIIAKKFHGRKSYKTRESKLLYIGNFEGNIDLSHFYLAVQFLRKLARIGLTVHSDD